MSTLSETELHWYGRAVPGEAPRVPVELPQDDPARLARQRQNRFWREHGYHHGHTRLRNRPEIFIIESTDHCNLQCVMCPRGEPNVMTRPLGLISDGLFRKILDQGEFYTDPCWLHWFGEPLMHPGLYDQIAYAKSKGIPNLGISTNATLLTEARARRLLESPLDTINIALDGTTKDVYERVRKSSQFTFEDVMENTRRLLSLRKSLGQRKPHVVLSIIVMEETKAQLRQFKAYWEGHGADEILHKPYVVWANQTPEFVPLAPSEDRARLAGTIREHPCKFLWESVVISWNGLVVPCCFDYDAKLALGDLNTQSLDEIWNGEAYVNLRKIELEKRNDTTLCRNCNQAPGHARAPCDPYRPDPRPVVRNEGQSSKLLRLGSRSGNRSSVPLPVPTTSDDPAQTSV